MDIDNLTDRMIRAAKLEVDLYEEVESDNSAMNQAIAVVVLSSISAGIGYIGEMGARGLILGTIGSLLAWVIWAYLTYLIGTKLLPTEKTESNMGELLRTIGFSSSPGVLRIFGFVPGLGPLIIFGASIWMLFAMVIAVRQALDYESTGRAIGVCVIGWLVVSVVQGILISL